MHHLAMIKTASRPYENTCRKVRSRTRRSMITRYICHPFKRLQDFQDALLPTKASSLDQYKSHQGYRRQSHD